MTNTTKTFKIMEIQEIISKELLKLINNGWVIDRAYTINNLTHYELIKNNERITFGAKYTHERLEETSHYFPKIEAIKIVGMKHEMTFYEIKNGVYVKKLSELRRIKELQYERMMSRHTVKKNKEIKSKGAVDVAKRIKGFRSVPKMNIRVTRQHGQLAYKVENTQSGNVQIVSM